MIKLNLPEYFPKLLNQKGKIVIFDIIRKKYLILTPEEWVRQHFINYLINTLNYPKGLINVEGGLNYHSRMKRTDIIVFDNLGSPFILIECKAPNIPLDNEVVFQASVYNNIIKAPYVALTNGLQHYFLQFEGNEVKEIENLPYRE
jgi:hypothetical protein